jgi:hypothetical protein
VRETRAEAVWVRRAAGHERSQGAAVAVPPGSQRDEQVGEGRARRGHNLCGQGCQPRFEVQARPPLAVTVAPSLRRVGVAGLPLRWGEVVASECQRMPCAVIQLGEVAGE